MGFRAKNNNDGPNIDWQGIAKAIDEDVYDARVSLIVDLGTQERTDGVYHEKKDDYTYVTSNEEGGPIDEFQDRAEKLQSAWFMEEHNLYDFEEVEVDSEKLLEELHKAGHKDVQMGDTVYKLPFRISPRKDAQEIAYFADLVDTRVAYIKGEDPKQYRVALNRKDFKSGELNGHALSVVKPMKDGAPWTYSALSMHMKLAEACGKTEELLEENDVSVLLGAPLGIAITKREKDGKEYINEAKGKNLQALRKKDLERGITELDVEPQAISFEDVTVEQLEIAQLNKLVINKIKKATDYEGSQMQKALEEWEAKKGGNSKKAEKPVDDDTEESSADVQGEVKDDSTKAQKASEPAKKTTARKPRGKKAEAAKKPEKKAESESSEQESGEDGDDIPWR